ALQVFPHHFQILRNSRGELECRRDKWKVECDADVCIHPAYFGRDFMFFIRAIEGHGCAFMGDWTFPTATQLLGEWKFNRRNCKKRKRLCPRNQISGGVCQDDYDVGFAVLFANFEPAGCIRSMRVLRQKYQPIPGDDLKTWQILPALNYARLKLSSVSSSAPWRRRMLTRFCENAERGITTSHPASCALTLRSPCTWETKPTIDVAFLYFERILVMTGSGLMPLLFRSTIIRDGFSSAPSVFSAISLSVLTNSTFTLSLRETSWILATKKRSSTKAKIFVGASTRCVSGSILGEAWAPLWNRAPCMLFPFPWLR